MFEELLRDINTNRMRVMFAMGFALDHAEQSKDVVELLSNSLIPPETPIPKKIARLYVLSDILANCNLPVKNAFTYHSLCVLRRCCCCCA